jgi:hypothetical protein
MNLPHPPWSLVCPIDTRPLAIWLAEHADAFPRQASADKPQRVLAPPMELVQPVINAVLAHFPDAVAHAPMLSRMSAGQEHCMHMDHTPAHWITRVHVPIATNPDAWLMFEEEGRKVHFEAGHAYTFDMSRPHSFGNPGNEGRVHLIFEVMEASMGEGAIRATHVRPAAAEKNRQEIADVKCPE